MSTQFTYERKQETVNDGKAIGQRGIINIGGKSWHSIERLDGYKWLRPGTYQCEFGMWTSSSGNKKQAIRVLGSYSNGRIYFHPANKPRELAGCIAPGKTQNSTGVGSSTIALNEIFSELGGWEEGKKIQLEVVGNIVELSPGDRESAFYEESDCDVI